MPKARPTSAPIVDEPLADTPPVPNEDRPAHHQGPHADPADRKHLWEHPASAHDPYPAPAAPDPAFETRWLHKRDADGAITHSRLVETADAHVAATAEGFA